MHSCQLFFLVRISDYHIENGLSDRWPFELRAVIVSMEAASVEAADRYPWIFPSLFSLCHSLNTKEMILDMVKSTKSHPRKHAWYWMGSFGLRLARTKGQLPLLFFLRTMAATLLSSLKDGVLIAVDDEGYNIKKNYPKRIFRIFRQFDEIDKQRKNLILDCQYTDEWQVTEPDEFIGLVWKSFYFTHKLMGIPNLRREISLDSIER